MGTTPGDEQVIRDVMDRWKAGVDAHEPAEVAGCFTEDAIFQGMRPYSVGRRGVTDYYASQPMGMQAAYKVLETRRLAEGLVLGYLWVDFSYTDKATLGVHLGVLATRTPEGWRLAHYQVSYLP
jgi:uncharacterized protein (TIGR02246 family)